MWGLFLDVVVSPVERVLWELDWTIPAALVVIVAAIVVAIVMQRKKKKGGKDQ